MPKIPDMIFGVFLHNNYPVDFQILHENLYLFPEKTRGEIYLATLFPSKLFGENYFVKKQSEQFQ